ncbi:MAG TPA: hypothetical protein VJ962_11285 [Clostridia bacterium]|nr:hypothetical protein [Clostridia bacterium]
MNELIDLSRKKLELLKNNGEARMILELDIAFNNAYKAFLLENNLKSLAEIDKTKYMEQLKHLKTIVSEIYTIESNESKVQVQSNKKNHNKKITNLYKKNMK